MRLNENETPSNGGNAHHSEQYRQIEVIVGKVMPSPQGDCSLAMLVKDMALELIERRALEAWRPISDVPDNGLFLVHEHAAIRMRYRSNGKWAPPESVCGVTGCHEPSEFRVLPAGPRGQE